MANSLTINVTDVFLANKNSDKYITLNRGGTRSSKTYSLCQLAFNWLISDLDEEYWSICRSTLPALKATAYRDFISIMNQTPYGSVIQHNRTELTFTYKGKHVEFFSLDDEQKIRSRKRDRLHICESNEIDYDMFIQLMIRTSKAIYLDINPSDSGDDNWIKNEIEDKRLHDKKDVKLIVSTYKDNQYLSKQEIENIEYLAKIDPELWKVFGLGEWGAVRGLVFPDVEVIENIPESVELYYIGLDFGFTDPCTAVLVGVDHDNLYLSELFYESGLTIDEVYAKLDRFSELIVADAANPGDIEWLKRKGLNIQPAWKGKGSIYSGVMQMKAKKIFITSKSVNLQREMRNYKWDNDKADQPIDAFNHAIDAARYVVQTKLDRKKARVIL